MLGDNSLSIIVSLKDRVSSQLNTIRGKIDGMQPAFQGMAAGGTAAAAGIGYLGKKSLDAAGEAEVVQGRFEAVFDETEKATSKWVDKMADDYGRAESTMQSTASNVGGQLQMVANNLPSEKISEMSKNLSEQSIAMSAYYKNLTSTEDASNAISKALAGQTDRLTEMGYQVGKQSENFEKMRKKMGFAKDEMNASKEAQIIYNLIMKQNKMVMEAYSETQDSYQEKMQRAKEQVKKASETIGKALIPMITKLLNKITPLISKLASWIEKNPKLVKWIVIAAGVLATLVAVIGALGMVLPAIITGFTLLLSPIALVIGAILALIAVGAYFYTHWEEIIETLQYLWEGFKYRVQSVLNNIKNSFIKDWTTVKDFFVDLWEGIKGTFSDAIDWIKDKIDSLLNVVEKVKNAPGAAMEKIKGSVSGAGEWVSSKLPWLQEGGIVPGSPNQAIPAILHGGETVIPADKKVGNTYNFDFSGAFIGNVEEFKKDIINAIDRESELKAYGGT